MYQDLTVNEFNNVVKRAIGNTDGMSKESVITLLEYALVKALREKTEMRRELRRLNQSVRNIKAIEALNRELQDEVNVLVEMLDHEDNDDVNNVSDTDPAPAPLVNFESSYNDWDMATRYPSLTPRKVG